jgi:dihydropyrimidinase
MVSKGRLGLRKFVDVTATAPAHIYNLSRKGSIAIGMDADIAIWDADRMVTIEEAMMHDRAGYSPYAGRKLQGWPTQVLSRGRIVVESGTLKAGKGTGKFLARDGGEAAKPANDSAEGQAATWRSYVL